MALPEPQMLKLTAATTRQVDDEHAAYFADRLIEQDGQPRSVYHYVSFEDDGDKPAAKVAMTFCQVAKAWAATQDLAFSRKRIGEPHEVYFRFNPIKAEEESTDA